MVTIEEDYIGSLINILEVSSEQGARGIYTHTLLTGRRYYLPVIMREN